MPGTNPGEREGELAANEGETNNRRTREWLVLQIVAALRELEAKPEAAEATSQPDESP